MLSVSGEHYTCNPKPSELKHKLFTQFFLKTWLIDWLIDDWLGKGVTCDTEGMCFMESFLSSFYVGSRDGTCGPSGLWGNHLYHELSWDTTFKDKHSKAPCTCEFLATWKSHVSKRPRKGLHQLHLLCNHSFWFLSQGVQEKGHVDLLPRYE